jgi:hypothetical protein
VFDVLYRHVADSFVVTLIVVEVVPAARAGAVGCGEKLVMTGAEVSGGRGVVTAWELTQAEGAVALALTRK